MRLGHLDVWSLLYSVLVIKTKPIFIWTLSPNPHQEWVILCFSRSEKPTSDFTLRSILGVLKSRGDYFCNYSPNVVELADLSWPFFWGLPTWESWILFASSINCVSLNWIWNYQVIYLWKILFYKATCRNTLHFPYACLIFFNCKVSYLYCCHPSSCADHKEEKFHPVSKLCSCISPSVPFAFKQN